MVCNADEGEPGTFKDRVILAEFADLVFEGMTIGGVGHRRGAGDRLPPRGIHLSSPAPGSRAAAPPRRRPAGARRRRTGRIRLRHRHPHGLGGLRLRRGNGPHRVLGRAAGRAPQPPALPHRHRLHGQSDDRQQRRDLRLGDVRADEGARLVQEHRHREIDRAQAVQHLRRLRPARRLRVPHGDHGGGTAEGSRRRSGESGADRRRRRPVRARRRISTGPSLTKTSSRAGR